MKQKTYSDIRPEKNFSIENIENGKCTVLFFDDIQEEKQESTNMENQEIGLSILFCTIFIRTLFYIQLVLNNLENYVF